MSFLYFVIMIGALVFFHELGHFVVAKLCGVKVLRFSIGFGPRIVGFTRGETEYVIGMLPLGGYVLMLGHDFADLENVTPEDRGRALMAKPIWQRSLVVLAGPVFNLILPAVIYFIFGLTQTVAAPALIGEVFDDTPAQSVGLRPGDTITAIDGEPVRYWHEMLGIISPAHDKPLPLTYERDGQSHTVTITPEKKTSTDSLGLNVRTYGMIGIHLGAYGATLAIDRADSPAQAAGLRSFDRIVAVNGAPIKRYDELEARVRASKGAPLELVAMRPEPARADFGTFYSQQPLTVSVTPIQRDGELTIGTTRAEMVLSEISPDSPAARAGLQVGDRVISLNGKGFSSWGMLVGRIHNQINEAILARPKDDPAPLLIPFEVVVIRQGEPVTLTLTPNVQRLDSKAQPDGYKIDIGWGHVAHLIMPEEIPFPLGQRLMWSASNSVTETAGYVKMMFMALVRMAQGRVGMESVGGPILIGELAAKAGEAGIEPFLKMMALISINLAVFNLLPIPVLDGGQLTLFAMEAVKRGPLSFRVRQIAAYVGFALIVMIMILAFKNDLERNWDRIVDFVSGS